jgi:hypothetical protein
MGVKMRLTVLEPEEGRVLQWLASEYQRQARGPRMLDEVETELRLKRGRLNELLENGALAGIVSKGGGKGGERIWLTSEGYVEALNLLAMLPRRH